MKKRFFFIIFLGVFFVGLVGTIVFGLGFFLSPQSKLSSADAIVVISGGRTTIRAEHGIDLYRQGLATSLVVSGAAQDDGPSNAAAMRTQAIEAGIAKSAILTDEDSQTTYQNAVDTKRLIDDKGYKKIILVTSPYHQRRASMTFHKVYGDSYTILNSSAIDDRWSKRYWFRSGFSMNISMEELRKIIWIWVTGQYQ